MAWPLEQGTWREAMTDTKITSQSSAASRNRKKPFEGLFSPEAPLGKTPDAKPEKKTNDQNQAHFEGVSKPLQYLLNPFHK